MRAARVTFADVSNPSVTFDPDLFMHVVWPTSRMEHVVRVSSSTGSDTPEPGMPFKTLRAAHDHLYNKSPKGGLVLLKAGDVFTDTLGDQNGTCRLSSDIEHPLIVASDDSSAAYPVIRGQPSVGACFVRQGYPDECDSHNIIGVRCEAPKGGASVNWIGGGQPFYNDCVFYGGQLGANMAWSKDEHGNPGPGPKSPRFDHVVVTGQRYSNGHANGLFIVGHDVNAIVNKSVLYNIGSNSIFEQGIYSTNGSGLVLVEESAFGEVSSHAVQGRSGLSMTNCFIGRVPCGVLGGGGDPPVDAGGVGVYVNWCVFQDACGAAYGARGWGIEASNAMTAEIQMNLFAHRKPGDKSKGFAVRLTGAGVTAGSGVGVQAATVLNNVWDTWPGEFVVLNNTGKVNREDHGFVIVAPGRCIQDWAKQVASADAALVFRSAFDLLAKCTGYHAFNPAVTVAKLNAYMREGYGMPLHP